MAPPTLWQHFRQTVGRALRETGQALDRVALRLENLALTQRKYGDDPVAWQDFLSRHRQRYPLLHAGRPVVHPDAAFLAPCATLTGSVAIGPGASVWYGAILRGDTCSRAESFRQSDKELLAVAEQAASQEEPPFELGKEDVVFYPGGGIFIGADTNVQDGCILTARTGHCTVGRGVTVGHLAQIHSATVGDYSLIGMGSVLQQRSRIEAEAFVAAGAVVGPDQVVPSGELWVGNPARKLRNLSAEERQKLHYQSSEYVQVALTQRNVMELGGNLNEAMIDRAIRLEQEEQRLQQLADGGSDSPENEVNDEKKKKEEAPSVESSFKVES